MRVQFQRTGGLAAPAQRRAFTVDTDTLSPTEAAELAALVRAAGLDDDSARPSTALEASVTRANTSPDAFRYRISVEHPNGRSSEAASDDDMREPLRPLVEWLERYSPPRSDM